MLKQINLKKKMTAKRIVLGAAMLYLLLSLHGAIKVQEPYSTARSVTISYPIVLIDKGFVDHLKFMIFNPDTAWHYLWVSKDEILMEICIEISQANGIDTTTLEMYLSMYNVLDW